MPSCVAVNCKNRGETQPKKSFHGFPLSKPDLVNQWVFNIHRAKFWPNTKSVLCSDHFTPDCFDRTGQTIRLKEGSVPTLFQFPDVNKKLVRLTKWPVKPSTRLCATVDFLPLGIEQGTMPNAAATVDSAASVVVDNDHSYHLTTEPGFARKKVYAVEG